MNSQSGHEFLTKSQAIVIIFVMCVLQTFVIAMNTVRITYTTQEVIDIKAADRWSGSDMHRWASELRRLNPSMEVPETKRAQ